MILHFKRKELGNAIIAVKKAMNRVTVIKSAKTREVVEVATEGLLSVTTATVMGILQETAENLAGDREAVIVTRMIEEAIP